MITKFILPSLAASFFFFSSENVHAENLKGLDVNLNSDFTNKDMPEQNITSASGSESQAVSIDENSDAEGDKSISMGQVSSAKGFYATAVGPESIANGRESSVFGHRANSYAHHGTALGRFAKTEGDQATALGSFAEAYEKNSVAIGSDSKAKRKYDENINSKIKEKDDFLTKKFQISEISVGDDNSSTENGHIHLRQITHVAPGTENTDVASVGQLNKIRTEFEKTIGTFNDLQRAKTETEEHRDAANTALIDTEKAKTKAEANRDAANTAKEETEQAKTETKGHRDAANKARIQTEVSRDVAKKVITQLNTEVSEIGRKIKQEDDTGTIHIAKKQDGKTISVSGTQGNRLISGIADGVKGNDVVNISQLSGVKNIATTANTMATGNTSRIKNLEKGLAKTNKKINRGLASSAALTGLFQPYGVGKVNFTASMGGYGSSNAIAIGSGYRVTENAAIKAGLAYSGENSITYNVSFNLEW